MADSGGFPRRFDSYVLLKPLARGGMGELYLAVSGARGIEKLCVIKKVLPSLVARENLQRFREEAMVVVKLSHGNLVSVFDAGRQQDQVYLAMDYIDGKDLLATWNRCADRRVPFPVDVAVYIVKELARGLAYAHGFHGLQLVHRDVSPANVLLSYTGEVKLTDFGLATSTLKLQHTQPGIIFGKLSYLSPEQARSEPLDGRTDLYAAGILLWELLTGQQLFPVRLSAGDDPDVKRDSTAGALERVRNPRVAPPSTITGRVPPELDRIVMRALAPERERRYQDGEELRADLAAFLAKTAPETDAARLAAFMRPLFAADMEAERRERESLMQGASNLLSGSIDGGGGTPAEGGERAATAAPPPAPVPASGSAPTAGAANTDSLSQDGFGASPGEDPRIGTTLGGRYYIRRLCGEGAMGRVYEAHHVDIGRRVAIKILHSNYRHREEVVERFRREARAASKIGHANIVDVTDSGVTRDGAFYFVMEYLDGVDLEQLIKRDGPLPSDRALLIAAQICRALQAAHAADVIHRDLKPANVMLVNRKDEEDFVKVLDFGISRNLDLEGGAGRRAGLTRPDVAVGTPTYMSPEQAAGMPADALADVYAVGGVLYEMLTGRPPCEGDDVLTVLNKKATEDPPAVGTLRPDLPVNVQRTVMRALSRAAKDRQPSMPALKEEVLACLGMAQSAPTPAGARDMPSDRRTAKVVTFRPRPWMLATGVGSAVALLALISIVRAGRHAGEAEAGPSPPLFAAPASAPAPAPTAVARAAAPKPTAAMATTAMPPAPLPPASTTAGRVAAAPALAPPPSAPVAAGPMPGDTSGRAPAPLRIRPYAGALPRPPVSSQGDSAGAWPPPAPTPVAATATSPVPSPAVLRRPSGSGAAASDRRASALAAAAFEDPGTSLTSGVQPETSTELLGRAQRAFDRGNYAEAVRRGKEAVSAGAEVGGHLLIGDAYFHLQRYADAAREYRATLALEPANALAQRGRDLSERAAADESR